MLPLLLALSAAAADRVLVLPLSGDGSHEGLGEALSVWITEDIGTSTAVHAVPRAEVEAAMPTGSSAPLTLNLDYAISGSWAVLDGDLSLSLRVGADTLRARGPLADFVLVEQELVTQLRSTLSAPGTAAPVPTESLTALAAWGVGLEARRGLKIEQARAAFAEAVGMDPRFARASADLSDLSDKSDLPQHPMRKAQDAIYAKYGPLSAAPSDSASLVGFALRLMAMENDGMHCQRAEEMERYLEFVQHNVSMAAGLTEASFATAVATEARALGFSAMTRSVSGVPEAAHAMPQRRVAGQFATSADFIFREASARNTLGSGLFGALAQCHPPEAAQARLAEHGASAMGRGLAEQLQKGRPAPGWTLRESLEIGWAQLQAEVEASKEFERRLDALTAVRSSDDPIQQQLLDRARDLRTKAGRSTRVVVKAPTSDSELTTLLRGAADGAENVVSTEPMGCKQALDAHRGEFYAWVSQAGTASMEDPATRQEHQLEGTIWVAALSELGCLDQAAPHATAQAVQTSVEQRLDNLPPGALSVADCGERVTRLRTELGQAPTPAQVSAWVFGIQAIDHRCR